ncbi:uncharacterized protein LOC106880929 [Octopus bimaculoides]|uniref:uncharacterized protein LOC106880929 n=1 Tax=Octopus bimaculoides TaxID=37653 RepID=UPI00071CFD54|nr:uncharacterized protein LOC106880929 [Octopus bimaculoides]|eukprot:XP_014786587.1 PREDICTED: uncharacterized protein LOC106880929 [Octopus bimaculoides]
MHVAVDRLLKEMNARFFRLHDLDAKFGFIIDVQFLRNGSFADLRTRCNTFGNVYSNDIDATELFEEILDCRMLLAGREHLQISNPEELLQFIVQYEDESVFPNLRVAIQILLTVAVSIAGCKRSFNKLNLIMSPLRASMTQGRLRDLALLGIEREEVISRSEMKKF